MGRVTLQLTVLLRERAIFCPELYHFLGSAYCTPSSLFCGDHILQSEEGVQQGDPLGPLLFCLTIHPLVSQLRSEFKVFYLDDGTLGGSVECVLRDLQQLEIVAAELGLQLNHQKMCFAMMCSPTKQCC